MARNLMTKFVNDPIDHDSVWQDHHQILQFPDTAAVFEFDPGLYQRFW